MKVMQAILRVKYMHTIFLTMKIEKKVELMSLTGLKMVENLLNVLKIYI